MTAPTTAASTAASLVALDAAYRAATARTSLAVVRALMMRWTSVDAERISTTSLDWLRDGVELVLAGQRDAAGLANLYTEQVRKLQVPDAPPFTPAPTRPPNREQVQRSLVYTGLHQTAEQMSQLSSVRNTDTAAPEAKREDADQTYEGRKRQVMSDGIARAAGAAARLITVAGHESIDDNIQADEVALGWARTTKAGCCYFCAMLASRGYVYKEDSFSASDPRFTGPGDHKVHDYCGCGLRPVYDPNSGLPDRTEALETLWTDMTRETGVGGKEAIREFRRRYEASPLAQRAA